MYFSRNAWSVARCFALKKRLFTVPQLTHTAYGELHGKVGERRVTEVPDSFRPRELRETDVLARYAEPRDCSSDCADPPTIATP